MSEYENGKLKTVSELEAHHDAENCQSLSGKKCNHKEAGRQGDYLYFCRDCNKTYWETKE